MYMNNFYSEEKVQHNPSTVSSSETYMSEMTSSYHHPEDIKTPV